MDVLGKKFIHEYQSEQNNEEAMQLRQSILDRFCEPVGLSLFYKVWH
jgi:hypothetical protein